MRKQQKVFLSVILPTYNRKHCVCKMIESVIMQDFKDFELIIIDDGSSDGTAEMIQKRYRDRRIVLVKRENGGVSSARNLGISLAKGKYITFVDSDDYLLQGFFSDIYQVLQKDKTKNKADVVVYAGYMQDLHRVQEVPLFWQDWQYNDCKISAKGGMDFLRDFCVMSGNSWACAKVFKTLMIAKHKIEFDKDISYGEDMLFNIQAYSKASKVMTIPKKFYVCNIGNKSLSRGEISSIDKVKNLIRVYEKMQMRDSVQSLLALNCIRHMRKWILFSLLRIDKNTKEKIQKIYLDISDDICLKNEKIEKLLSQWSILCAISGVGVFFAAQAFYTKISFIHPLTSPLVRIIKRKLSRRKKQNIIVRNRFKDER